MPSIRELDLSNNELTDDGVENLLSTDLPQQLKRLVLGGNDITNVGAAMLAEQWPTGDADRLENLNLRFTPIGQAGQAALLRRFGGPRGPVLTPFLTSRKRKRRISFAFAYASGSSRRGLATLDRDLQDPPEFHTL